MALTLLEDAPLAPALDLGPYRPAAYRGLAAKPPSDLSSGRLSVNPSPTRRHQRVVFALGRRIEDASDATGGEVDLAPMDVELADHSIVQPDVIYVSPERRHILGERIHGVPDLLVEVLSPRTVRRDRGEKLDLYARSGVREYWLVDSEAQQIEFLVNRDGQFVVVLPVDGIFRSTALPGLALDLAEFWAEVERRMV